MEEVGYACVVCKDECVYDCVFCDECFNWTHFKCMNITEYETDLLCNGSNQYFYCAKCCSDNNGLFNFEKSLNRLSEASDDSIETLLSVAIIEEIMMKQLPISNYVEENFDYTEKNVDGDNCKLLKRFRTFKHVALHSTSDGNCMFNSLSILLFGNEKSSAALRVKTCVYMALHKEEILENIPNDLLFISSDFDDSLIKCSRNNSWSDPISIFAAASALSVNIKMIYPPMNGLIDLNFEILNKTLTPLGKNPSRTIMLMWTGGFTEGFNYEGDYWIPNHFVPIILKSSNGKYNHLHTGHFSCNLNSDFEIFQKAKTLQNTDGTDANKFFIVKDELDESSAVNNLRSNCDDENLINLDGSSEIPLLPGSTRNNGTFLEADEIINILINHKNPIPEMPLGEKVNCYFVVCNRKNIERKSRKLDYRFNDDCGVWTNSSSKTAYFLIDSKDSNVKYKYIEMKSGQFYSCKKKGRVLMDPQPKQSEVLALKRRYDKLERDRWFQRKISFFENGNIAIYEYKCSMPITRKPMTVYGDFVLQDLESMPRDIKQKKIQKKALQAMRVAKPESQASNTPPTKRPLESSADALEHAKQLLKSGAIKLNNENKDKQSFKRSKNFEKKLKDPDKTPSAVGFQPFSAAHPDSLEKDKEKDEEREVSKPRRKTLSESFVLEGSMRESKDNSDGEQQQTPYKRPRLSGFDRDREDRRDNPKKGNTIYVHGHGVTEELLRKAFATFGTIVNITMELDRNCGFVSFEKMESAEQAISDVNGSIISDVQLKVSLARKQPSFNQPHDQSPSWGAIAASSQSTSNYKDKREKVSYDDIFS